MDAALALEKFKEYLESTIEEPLTKKNVRLLVDMNELRLANKELSLFISNNPGACIPWFEEEIREKDLSKHLGFTGSLGMNATNPRIIDSSFIGKLVCIEGIVISVSLVRPKLRKSVHYSQTENEFYMKEYRDGTILSKLPPTNFSYPLKNQNGNSLDSEFGLSEYIDFQTIRIQEMPEKSPPGQLPRSIECILSEDIVDMAKPGDRIKAYGVYKSFCNESVFPSRFRTVLIANNIEKNAVVEGVPDMDAFKLLATSSLRFKAIAPTIHGYDDIKKALALMMVGGNEKRKQNKR
jgi:DNA replication licensing factor MCM3